MDLQGLLSTPPFFSVPMNVVQSYISTLFVQCPILYGILVIVLPQWSCCCCSGLSLPCHDFLLYHPDV